MKCMESITTVGALVWLTGCASSPNVAILEPVGPAPMGQAQAMGQGSLQVYSARLKEPIETSYTEWERDYNLGRNAFTYGLAHTDYIILAQDGKNHQYVRNARDAADPKPALVSLAAGRYQVEAEAEEYGSQTVKVVIPVVIEPGKTTVAHLSGN